MCPHRLAALLGMAQAAVEDAVSAAAEEAAVGARAADATADALFSQAAATLLGGAATTQQDATLTASPPSPSVDWAWLGLCALSGAGFLALAAAVKKVVVGQAAAAAPRCLRTPPSSPSPLLEPLAPGEVAGANPAFFGAGKV